jgi:hypothetical protein
MSAKRPSCFGLPSVLSFTAPACGACPARTDCIRTCHELLVALSQQFDVKAELEHYRHHAGALLSEPVPAPVVAPVVQMTIAAPAQAVPLKGVKITITPDQEGKLKELPVKVAQKVRALMEKGIDVRAKEELTRGVNPFDGHPSLFVAADILLKGFKVETATLKGELKHRFQWTDGTAASRASSTIGVLKAIGVMA